MKTRYGPRIPKEKFETIFARFARLGSQDKTGLGLGLCSEKMFAEAHHGKIWVESGNKTRSLFYVSLPLNGPSPTKIQEAFVHN